MMTEEGWKDILGWEAEQLTEVLTTPRLKGPVGNQVGRPGELASLSPQSLIPIQKEWDGWHREGATWGQALKGRAGAG